MRERAYFSWERAGRPEGRAAEFWEQAQRDEAAHAAEEDERVDEEGRESFPPSDPPCHAGITGGVGAISGAAWAADRLNLR